MSQVIENKWTHRYKNSLNKWVSCRVVNNLRRFTIEIYQTVVINENGATLVLDRKDLIRLL